MKTGLVTIVVPIYNTEKYLDRCVGSIVNQTYRNLENLLIDDGSTDSCPRMCDAWAEKDSRIRVFHKENEGQGLSRNVGIAHATGEYIYFIDSDDYIHPETIEKAYSCAAQNQAEVVIFGFSAVDAAGRVHSPFAPQGKPVYRGTEVQEEFLPELIAPDPKGDGKRKLYIGMWLVLVSCDVIRRANWRFVSERVIISEDTYSMIALMRHVGSVAILPEPLYYYCANPKSFSRSYTPGRYARVRHWHAECLELCTRLGYEDEIKHRIASYFLGLTIATLKQEMAEKRSLWKRMAAVREIMMDAVLQEVLERGKEDHVNWKQKILFWSMRNKRTAMCCALLWLQNVVKK